MNESQRNGGLIPKNKKRFICIDCHKPFYAVWSKLKRCELCRDRYWRQKKAIMKKGSIHRYSKPTGKKVKCHKCGKKFELREWQWEGMAWCDQCRRTPEYLSYSTINAMTQCDSSSKRINIHNQLVREYYQEKRQLDNFYYGSVSMEES